MVCFSSLCGFVNQIRRKNRETSRTCRKPAIGGVDKLRSGIRSAFAGPVCSTVRNGKEERCINAKQPENASGAAGTTRSPGIRCASNAGWSGKPGKECWPHGSAVSGNWPGKSTVPAGTVFLPVICRAANPPIASAPSSKNRNSLNYAPLFRTIRFPTIPGRNDKSLSLNKL